MKTMIRPVNCVRGSEARDTEDVRSALRPSPRFLAVAQVSNLPYRRLPVGSRSATSGGAVKTALFLVCALAAWVVAGCKSTSPSHYVSPRVEGRVLNAQTHQPVTGVKVRRLGSDPDKGMDAPHGGQAIEQTQAPRTARDGTFVLVSERDLAFIRQSGWYSITLAFEYTGYLSFTTNYTLANSTRSPSGEPLVKTGDILLMPLSR